MLSAHNGLAEIVMASIGNTWKKLQEKVVFHLTGVICFAMNQFYAVVLELRKWQLKG